jgi:prolyl 4-hydroxylase
MGWSKRLQRARQASSRRRRRNAGIGGGAYHYETPRIAPGTRIHTSDREISVLLRLAQPVLVVLEDVLSPDECDLLIEQSRSRLQPSTVVDLETARQQGCRASQ